MKKKISLPSPCSRVFLRLATKIAIDEIKIKMKKPPIENAAIAPAPISLFDAENIYNQKYVKLEIICIFNQFE